MAAPDNLPEFGLEIYFAQHEFTAKYLLCCSDAETFSINHILSFADDETRELWDNLACGYTEAPGNPILRTEIVKQFYSNEHFEGEDATDISMSMGNINSDENVLCFAGAEEAIYATMRALLTDDDHVVVITPAYQSLLSIAAVAVHNEERRGEGITTLDLEVVGGRWTLDMLKLREAVQPGKTKMIIMNFPHNPTGALLTAEEQLEVVCVCQQYDIWVFFDEVYRGLELDETKRLPPMCTLYPRALSLGVMSKSFGLAGLRVGWLCTQDTYALAKIAKYKHYLSICNSAPSEILSLIALRAKESLLERNNSLIAENMSHLELFFNGKWGNFFDWVAPEGGCIGYMRFKGSENNSITLAELADRLVNEFGVLLLPGQYFPANDQDQFVSHFRFGFGRRNFIECLHQFEAALEQILG